MCAVLLGLLLERLFSCATKILERVNTDTTGEAKSVETVEDAKDVSDDAENSSVVETVEGAKDGSDEAKNSSDSSVAAKLDDNSSLTQQLNDLSDSRGLHC